MTETNGAADVAICTTWCVHPEVLSTGNSAGVIACLSQERLGAVVARSPQNNCTGATAILRLQRPRANAHRLAAPETFRRRKDVDAAGKRGEHIKFRCHFQLVRTLYFKFYFSRGFDFGENWFATVPTSPAIINCLQYATHAGRFIDLFIQTIGEHDGMLFRHGITSVDFQEIFRLVPFSKPL
jgi:hypothetical protein